MAIEKTGEKLDLKELQKVIVTINENEKTLKQIYRENQKEQRANNNSRIKKKSAKTNVSFNAVGKKESKKDDYLGKAFKETFGDLKDFIKKPGSLLKSVGLFGGSPIMILLGDKLDELKESYDEEKKRNMSYEGKLADQMKGLKVPLENQTAILDGIKNLTSKDDKEIQKLLIANGVVNKELYTDLIGQMSAFEDELIFSNPVLEEQINQLHGKMEDQDEAYKIMIKTLKKGNSIALESSKPDFKKERNDEIANNLALKQTDLMSSQVTALQDLKEISEANADKAPSLLDSIMNPMNFFGRGGRAAKGGRGIMGGMKGMAKGGVRGMAKGGLKGLGKIGGGLLKGAGKIALPLMIASTAMDFIDGALNGKEITGKDGIAGVIQGGISQAISGLTFGLLDPKKVSKAIDFVIDNIKNLFLAPFNLIKDIFSGKDIIDSIGDYITKVSFGLIDGEGLKKWGHKIVNGVVGFFTRGFALMKEWFFKYNPIGIMWDLISNIDIDDFLSVAGWGKIIDLVKEKIFGLITAPFDMVKDLFKFFGGGGGEETTTKTTSSESSIQTASGVNREVQLAAEEFRKEYQAEQAAKQAAAAGNVQVNNNQSVVQPPDMGIHTDDLAYRKFLEDSY